MGEERTGEKNRFSFPVLVFSICGSLLLLLYGWLRNDFAIILGQLLSYYIYLWNLKANGLWRGIPLPCRILLLILPPAAASAVALAVPLAATLFRNPDIPLPLLVFGCASQALFTLRFVYQWWYSARRGISVLPMGFWIISLTGSLLICLYGVLRLDIVLILGQSLGLIALFPQHPARAAQFAAGVRSGPLFPDYPS